MSEEWLSLVVVLAEIGGLGSLLMLAFSLRQKVGLAPVYLIVGALLVIEVVFASTFAVAFPLVGQATIGSTVVFPAVLLSVILLYVLEGTLQTRRFIVAIVGANLVAVLLFWAAHLQVSSTFGIPFLSPEIHEMFFGGSRIIAAGTAALIIDLVLVSVVFQTIRNWLPTGVPLGVALGLGLVVMLLFDSALFVTAAFGERPDYQLQLSRNAFGKLVAAGVYTAVVAAWSPLVFRGLEQRGLRRLPWEILGYDTELKRVSTALAESESRLSVLLDGSMDVIVATDSDGLLTYVNRRVEDLLGYTPEELIGRPFLPYIEEPMRAEFARNFQRAARGEIGDMIYHFQLIDKSGALHPCEMQVTSIFQEAKFKGRFAVIRSQSERRAIERALADRTRELEGLVEASRTFSSTLDLEAVVQRICEVTERSLGVSAVLLNLYDPTTRTFLPASPGDLAGASAGAPPRGPVSRELLEPVLSRELEHGRSVVLGGGPPPDPGLAKISKFFASKFALCVPLMFSGRLSGLLCIDDPKRTAPYLPHEIRFVESVASQAAIALENARLYSEARKGLRELSSLYQTTYAISSTLDLQANLQLIADEAQKLVAADEVMIFTLDESTENLYPVVALGKYAKEILAEAPLKVGEGFTGWVAKTGVGEILPRADLDSRAVQVAGTPQEPECLMSVPMLSMGRIIGVITVSRYGEAAFEPHMLDLLTAFSNQAAIAIENARLYDETVRAKTEAETYVDLVSHDIGNYCTPIAGYLEVLGKEGELTAVQRRFVSNVQEQVRNIMGLVRNVRALSQARVEVEKSLVPVDLGRVLADTGGDVKRMFPQRSVDLRAAIPPNRHFVLADGLIEHLFVNLLQNAVKVDPHPTAVVELSIDPWQDGGVDYWRVAIADHGPGIPRERRRDLFVRTARYSADRRVRELGIKGSGMGLPIVKALTERYGGRVWVEDRVSGEPAAGSVFYVALPQHVGGAS